MSFGNFFYKLKNKFNLELKPTNKNEQYIGLCPFHQEKTASFFINFNVNAYHCFGCGAKGRINDKSGFSYRSQRCVEDDTDIDRNAAQNYFSNVKMFVESSCSYLLNNSRVLQHFSKTRNLTLEKIQKFKIGIVDRQSARRLLEKINDKKILRLFKQVYRNEIIVVFPIFSVELAKYVGFGYKKLHYNFETIGYFMLPNSCFFKKREALFYCAGFLDRRRKICLTEGYFDSIALSTRYNAIATMGVSISEKQVETIINLCEKNDLLLFFDNDFAGFLFTLKVYRIFNFKHKVRMFDWSDFSAAKDADEVCRCKQRLPAEFETVDIDCFVRFFLNKNSLEEKQLVLVFECLKNIEIQYETFCVFKSYCKTRVNKAFFRNINVYSCVIAQPIKSLYALSQNAFSKAQIEEYFSIFGLNRNKIVLFDKFKNKKTFFNKRQFYYFLLIYADRLKYFLKITEDLCTALDIQQQIKKSNQTLKFIIFTNCVLHNNEKTYNLNLFEIQTQLEYYDFMAYEHSHSDNLVPRN